MATLGEQLNAAAIAHAQSPFIQEIGETVQTWEKDHIKSLTNAVSAARQKGIKGLIYIQVVEEPIREYVNGTKFLFVVRKSRPKARPGMVLWSHKEGDSAPTLEYSLPRRADCAEVLQNPSKYPPKLVIWCRKWAKGELK